MKRRVAAPLLLMALAGVIAATFAWHTRHVWEDFYITYRVSKNLVLGHGLVYQVGERVHTFTSPLGVLLPALTLWVTGGRSDAAALIGFQALSIVAWAGSIAAVWVLCRRRWELSAGTSVVAVVLLLTDAKAVDFSVNGMETGFMLLFLALFLLALQTRDTARGWIHLGLAAAGLQWTRPDACVVGVAVAAGFGLFSPQSLPGGDRRTGLVFLVKAAALAAILYLPWIVFAAAYYGSPIPNTVVAKVQAFSGWAFDSWREWLRVPWLRGLGAAPLPIYAHMGGWPEAALVAGYYTSCVLGHWWLLPWADRRGRACSFGAFLFGLYLSQINLYPWYLPPASLLAILTAAFAMTDAARWLHRLGRARWVGPACVGVGLVFAQLALLVSTARQVKLQQSLIEGQRAAIGLELKKHAQPNDRVFLECIGYIGFHSGLKVLDYPGLSAPEVVRARRNIGDDWALLVRHFKPEWLVLRPGEVPKVNSPRYPEFAADYFVAGTFSRQREIDTLRPFAGIDYLRYDQTFIVLHRR
ncbi:hypothetical protein [Horticoccus sp. 23ND18S-11]|uniref:hypothetical protein n=1 Tax=Horticoccus sp. 23ND18S-11 TaxID=3391832 RepID=UPI0039C95630